VLASFLASMVEFIEALTIVLAVGATRGWKPSLLGATAGLAPLAALVAAPGVSLASIPLPPLQLTVGVPLLLLFLWRGRNRAIYAAVFLVVASLELYGTAIGTWRWAPELPGLGIPDGNPPSGVASGYVWFDVMALLTAPVALAWLKRRASRTPRAAERPLQSTTPA